MFIIMIVMFIIMGVLFLEKDVIALALKWIEHCTSFDFKLKNLCCCACTAYKCKKLLSIA